jgi:hypothetical protein
MLNDNINKKPAYVFLLGAGRSGTKFLRDILDSSSSIGVIPYDVGYVWRYGNENFSSDELIPEMITPSIEKNIKNILPALVKKNGDDQIEILIEKSVPNTLRPSFIRRIYPDAKFIHLIRDGRSVTESAIRLWSSPPKKRYLLKKIRYFPWRSYSYAIWYFKNFLKGIFQYGQNQRIWGPRYSGIDKDVEVLPLELICARQWKRCVETSLSQLDSFPRDKVLTVHYEDLIKDQKYVEKICNFIGVSNKQDILDNYNKRVVRSNVDKWRESLSGDQLKIINKEISGLNADLGYAE